MADDRRRPSWRSYRRSWDRQAFFAGGPRGSRAFLGHDVTRNALTGGVPGRSGQTPAVAFTATHCVCTSRNPRISRPASGFSMFRLAIRSCCRTSTWSRTPAGPIAWWSRNSKELPARTRCPFRSRPSRESLFSAAWRSLQSQIESAMIPNPAGLQLPRCASVWIMTGCGGKKPRAPALVRVMSVPGFRSHKQGAGGTCSRCD